jgi:hypothetical protein
MFSYLDVTIVLQIFANDNDFDDDDDDDTKSRSSQSSRFSGRHGRRLGWSTGRDAQ